MEKNTDKKRITIFIGITFLLTYLLEIGVLYPLSKTENPSFQSIILLLTYLVMLIPSIGVVITRIVTKEGFHACNIKPRNLKKTWFYYLLGWFAPSLLILLGTVLFVLIFPDSYDSEMTLLGTALSTTGATFTNEQLKIIFLVQIIQAIIIGPIVNFVLCFGEEWGWRGYLLPKMRETMGIMPTLLVSGIIWGLWHAPLICMGHNYGIGYAGYPFTGILAMCLFCVCVGTFFSFLTLQSGSCLPAVLAHGALNGMGSIGVYITIDSNPFIGPNVTGWIGGMGFIVVALLSAALLKHREKK